MLRARSARWYHPERSSGVKSFQNGPGWGPLIPADSSSIWIRYSRLATPSISASIWIRVTGLLADRGGG